VTRHVVVLLTSLGTLVSCAAKPVVYHSPVTEQREIACLKAGWYVSELNQCVRDTPRYVPSSPSAPVTIIIEPEPQRWTICNRWGGGSRMTVCY
jgi:hypothetical protein